MKVKIGSHSGEVPMEFIHLVEIDSSELTPHTDDLSAKKGVPETYCQADTVEKMFAAPPAPGRLVSKRFEGASAMTRFLNCVDEVFAGRPDLGAEVKATAFAALDFEKAAILSGE